MAAAGLRLGLGVRCQKLEPRRWEMGVDPFAAFAFFARLPHNWVMVSIIDRHAGDTNWVQNGLKWVRFHFLKKSKLVKSSMFNGGFAFFELGSFSRFHFF
jgi:hypothetical protein